MLGWGVATESYILDLVPKAKTNSYFIVRLNTS